MSLANSTSGLAVRLESESSSGAGAERSLPPTRAAWRPQGNKYPCAGSALGSLGRVSAIWNYSLEHNERPFAVARFDNPRDGSKTYRVASKYRGNWYLDLPESPCFLYRQGELDEARSVYVCGSEKTADLALSIGLAATTSLGGPTRAAMSNWFPVQGKHVFILRDFDEAGLKYAEEVAQLCLAAMAESVRIVTLPGLNEGENLVEWLAPRDCSNYNIRTWRKQEVEDVAKVAPLVEYQEPPPPSVDSVEPTDSPASETLAEPSTEPMVPRATVRRMSDVVAEPLEWILDGVIPCGKLTVLTGESGVGSSLLAMDLVAQVTRGSEVENAGGGLQIEPRMVGLEDSALPTIPADTAKTNEPHRVEPGAVLLFAAEGELANTVRSRLDAAGADPDLVYAMCGVENADGESGGRGASRSFQLNRDLSVLETELTRLQDDGVAVRMVVIDPIDSYFDSGQRLSDVRAAAVRLTELAARTGVAIVVVARHSRPGSGIARVLGGRKSASGAAFAEVAHSVWMVARDLDDPQRRLLLPVKTTLCETGPGSAFAIQNGGLEWEAEPVRLTAEEFLARAGRRQPVELDDRSELARAIEWLKERLADGGVATIELHADAKQCGFSDATLRRAYHWLRVKPEKRKGSGHWYWKLPGVEDKSVEVEGAKSDCGATAPTVEEAKPDAPVVDESESKVEQSTPARTVDPFEHLLLRVPVPQIQWLKQPQIVAEMQRKVYDQYTTSQVIKMVQAREKAGLLGQ